MWQHVGIKVIESANRNENQKKAYSHDLYRDLTSGRTRIVVSAGRHMGTITIATGRSCFVSCAGSGSDQYQIHFNNRPEKSRLIFNSYDGEQKPVIISRVPASTLRDLTKLNAWVEIR